MKQFISYAAAAALLVLLFATAITLHNQNVQARKSIAQNTSMNLQIVKAVDEHNLQSVQAELSSKQNELTTDLSTLCAFIKTNTKPNIAPPPLCQ